VLARAAHGSMRDALSLLDQAIAYGAGSVGEAVVRQMIGAVDSDFVVSLLEASPATTSSACSPRRGDGGAQPVVRRRAAGHRGRAARHRAVAGRAGRVAADLPARDRLRARRRMDPETVQLDYQIAVQGREDLPLAPDEFAGFSMTLLRMLAFAPAPAPACEPTRAAVRAAPPPFGSAARRSRSCASPRRTRPLRRPRRAARIATPAVEGGLRYRAAADVLPAARCNRDDARARLAAAGSRNAS
jgi:DNA polymerase-3 subunit gamma/tau